MFIRNLFYVYQTIRNVLLFLDGCLISREQVVEVLLLVCLQVAERFIRAVELSSNPKCNMAFFIGCDAKNILEQAAESTLRHARGMRLL